MKNFLILLTFFIAAILPLSCVEDNASEESENESSDLFEEKEEMTFEDIKRHIEAQLKILPSEDYKIQVYEKHLDTDDDIDKLITVNLLDKALKEAKAEGQDTKRAALGYMGNFNFIFYVDGKTQVITSPIAIPSSPHAELVIKFEHITSPTHLDFTLDFRIRRSVYRQFYTIRERIPIKVSESEVFQNIGTSEQQDFYLELEEVEGQPWKNIVVYEGISTYNEIPELLDTYAYKPEVKNSGKLIRRWYFSPKHLKYYVRNDEL